MKRLFHLIDPPICWRILHLAGPLILSMTGVLLMQLCDGLFLSWYSADAIAAVGPASMAALILSSIVMGAAGYTSTLTAHYYGAGQNGRIGPAVWQGIYVALASGCIGAALAPLGRAGLTGGPRRGVGRREDVLLDHLLWHAGLTATTLLSFFSGKAQCHADGHPAYRSRCERDSGPCAIWGRWGLPAWVAGAT